MLSKAKIKDIKALEHKKFRDDSGLFVAEGNKVVDDMIHSFECEWLIANASWMATQGDIPAKELLLAEKGDIKKISFLKTPQDVFAIFKKPDYQIEEVNPENQLVLALDGIQDPGNMGTIVRIADWFGIQHIVCSMDTTDVFSPKTVQATMGALAHVHVYYVDLENFLEKNRNCTTYGAFLEGENIYAKTLTDNGIIVMGNEGNGIRPEIAKRIGEKLFIPPYPDTTETTESLNVAAATAIICSEFRRKNLIPHATF
ncbi:MAG: RNA methyltransferase [Tannerella sp.]|jgi:TrmH family RNA methyltransferase|nr:RNA methyltransferase [Tannerella sp.]